MVDNSQSLGVVFLSGYKAVPASRPSSFSSVLYAYFVLVVLSYFPSSRPRDLAVNMHGKIWRDKLIYEGQSRTPCVLSLFSHSDVFTLERSIPNEVS